MLDITIAGLATTATEEMQGEAAAARTEIQNAIRQAVRDGVNGGLQGLPAPAAPFTQAPKATIDALQAQIAGERATIDKLTSQLTSSTSDAAERAITNQIESSQERLSSLQRQLDRALGGEETIAIAETPPPFPTGDIIPQRAADITYAFFATVTLIAIGVPLARAFARRLDRRGAPVAAATTNLEPRLDRIEQAIEAIAIEVERVSEGQRFTNKLMSEARALPAPNPLEQWPKAGVKESVPLERKFER